MPHYRCVGDVPRKRHTAFRDATGHRFAEELMGQEGFSSSSALLYHRHSPSAVVAIDAVAGDAVLAAPDFPVTPRHLRTGNLAPSIDVVTGRHVLLANRDVRLACVAADQKSPLYRNAVGDELVYVQQGTATIESVFGVLDVGPGDYVVIPAGTTHRWVHADQIELFVIEARGHVAPPKRYLSSDGQFLEHAPFCERDLRAPDAPLVVADLADGDTIDVLVRTRGGISRHTHRTHPFDVVGWDGNLYPWALSIHDFEPIVGRLHQPPPVHQTFEGPGFVVCSFVPRPFDFHPDAVKVPYHHSNTDSDEVLFYSAGNFMSRAGSGIGVGSISYHPAGFIHGPQPGSYEASVEHDRTAELAVMVDTFAPLDVTDVGREISAPEYPWTWAREPGT
ncbi:MAG TPA: homogentisate 1,2-dioxygenase [Ilumatobacter sp.]|nr:homogentisate 1,2-dioxygenase [Ilumatobacter sp.]